MGLDLTALGRQVRQMSHNAATEAADSANRVAMVHKRYLAADGEEMHWAHAVDLSRTSAAWLLARPVERFTTRIDPPVVPAAYALVATDGSQIELDHHGRAPCFVINIGQIYLRYGHQPTARLTSQPVLCYREEDLYLRDGARRIPIEGNYLSARRDVDEGLALADLAEEYLDGSLPAVALQDGTLVRWTLAGAERVVQDYFLSRYLSYLDRMRYLGIPVASYISRPRSPEVIGTIRLMHCPDVIVASSRGAHCEQCSDMRAGRPPSCTPCQDLVDGDILGRNLAEGQRGPLFLSMSRINFECYGPHRIHFFHMRVGRELCRIEIPHWVATDRAMVDRVHALVYDQCVRGDGYPVALARAHEQAVIRGADRRAFQRMLEGSLYRAEIPHANSAKADSKEFSRG